MKVVTRLKITGGVVGLLLAGTGYILIRNKKWDSTAGEILSALNQLANPDTLGVKNEKAFGVNYADTVLNSIPAKILILKKSTTIQIAQQIHSVWKPWYYGGDQEETLYGVFRNLKDKVQVSQIAKAYQDTYGINLIEKLHQRLDAAEIKKILDIVATMPQYRML